MDDAVNDIISENRKGTEVTPFIATPNRVSSLLDLDAEQVHTEFKSVEGRRRLFDSLMAQQEELKKLHPDFHPETLRTQLDSVGEALAAEERFFAKARSPEKKSMFARAWESITGFPRKHPLMTIVLAIAALTGAAIYMGWLPSIGGWGKGIGDGWNNILNWFKGGKAAEAGAEGAVSETVATEAAPAVEELNAAALRTAQEKLTPKTIDLFTIDHSIIYNGKTYDINQFKEIFPDVLKELDGEKILKITRDIKARTVTEGELRDLFKESGLLREQLKWTDNFSNGGADDY